MKTIGITGGVGAGKSTVLNYIEEHYNAYIIIADKLAYELESPGGVCYESIVGLLGGDILDDTGFIDKKKMASRIFSEPDLLKRVNDIIHPAVKQSILDIIDKERQSGRFDYLIVEAALLIEEGYGAILDELWYIRVDSDIRRARLKESRGYSDEKIDSIIASQLSDEEYMKNCKYVIDNSGCTEDTYRQISSIFRITG